MYTEYQPNATLSSFIDKYWEFKGSPIYRTQINILPDGCINFIFTLGEVTHSQDNTYLVMQPYQSYFVGPMTQYSTLITYAKVIHMLGIRFLPCGIFRFVNLPMQEFVNQRINTDELRIFFDNTLSTQLSCSWAYSS